MEQNNWDIKMELLLILFLFFVHFFFQVAIIRDDVIIFEFGGEIYLTPEHAVNMTARNVYYQLCNTLVDAQTLSVAPNQSGGGFQPNRIEACR